jgi:hypothetical protein
MRREARTLCSAIGVMLAIEVAQRCGAKNLFQHFAKNVGTGAVVTLGTAGPKMNQNNSIDNPFAIQSFSSVYRDGRENGGWSLTPESPFWGEIHYKYWWNAPEAGAFQGRKP